MLIWTKPAVKKNKIMKQIAAIAIASLLISTFFLASCDQNPLAYQSNTHSRGKIDIWAEQSYEPLFTTSINVFESQFPKAHVKAHYCSESDVIDAFLKKKTQTIFMSRDFTRVEKKTLRKKLIEVRSEKLAEDAVALIINPNNRDSTLTVVQLKKILKGEDIKWPSTKKQINIVFDNQNSANFRYLRDLARQTKVPDNVFAVHSNKEVIEYVKNNQNAIGVIGVNWISDKEDSTVLHFLDGIKVMSIAKDASCDYFKPFQAYIYTKEYPLTRELWAINMASRSVLNTGFINFLTGVKGQLIIQKSNLVPSNSPVRLIEIETN
jgi:phosphate transport system substrate-binding protein